MGVRIILGSEGGYGPADTAVLYDSTSGWAFGPIFSDEGETLALDRAEAFLRWFQSGTATDVARRLGLPLVTGDGDDPRCFDTPALERLHAAWLSEQEVPHA